MIGGCFFRLLFPFDIFTFLFIHLFCFFFTLFLRVTFDVGPLSSASTSTSMQKSLISNGKWLCIISFVKCPCLVAQPNSIYRSYLAFHHKTNETRNYLFDVYLALWVEMSLMEMVESEAVDNVTKISDSKRKMTFPIHRLLFKLQTSQKVNYNMSKIMFFCRAYVSPQPYMSEQMVGHGSWCENTKREDRKQHS